MPGGRPQIRRGRYVEEAAAQHWNTRALELQRDREATEEHTHLNNEGDTP